jgi:PncC family amidohydrolase
MLRESKYFLATAESCSGGLLGHLITNASGSSDYYLGGFITYSNQAKQLFLGVRPETLQAFGAVSRETVLEMARGAREAFKSVQPLERLIGLATSGIAGPTGGTPQKRWVRYGSGIVVRKAMRRCFFISTARAKRSNSKRR